MGTAKLYLHQHISIFNNQSGRLHSNQSGQCILDQSDWEFGVLICTGTDQPGTRAWTSVYKSASPLFQGHIFGFHWRLHFPGWRCNTEAVSLERDWAKLSCNNKTTSPQYHLMPRVASHHTESIYSWAYHSWAVCTQYKVSPFTAFQIGDSCWSWIGANDHWLTFHSGSGEIWSDS